MLRRSAGFDVPDFLAAGPRDVMVPISGGRSPPVRSCSRPISTDARPAVARPVAPGRLLAGLLAALVLGVLVVWLVGQFVR